MTSNRKRTRSTQVDGALQRSALVGRRLPELRVMLTTGRSKSIEPYLGAQNTLLCFFHGVWCAECVLLLWDLQRHLRKLAAAGIEIVAAIRDQPETIAAFVANQRRALTYTVVADPDGSAHRRVGAGGHTMMLLVDRNRMVRRITHWGDRGRSSDDSGLLDELQK
ncbi:MAG TPA: redoxin domain-containing protein [Anaerolineales bacterium]|nr:redoxin domain-containing protein [Anaerolineales bacterium]